MTGEVKSTALFLNLQLLCGRISRFMVKEALSHPNYRLEMQHQACDFPPRLLKGRVVLWLLISMQLWCHVGATTLVSIFLFVYHIIWKELVVSYDWYFYPMVCVEHRVKIVFQEAYKLATTYLKGFYDLCCIRNVRTISSFQWSCSASCAGYIWIWLIIMPVFVGFLSFKLLYVVFPD